MNPAHKACSKCRADKSLAEFYADKRASDGHSSSCKACDRARSRDWAQDNPERRAEIAAKWERENPDKRHAQNVKWEHANPERRREINDKWADANPAVYQESQRKAKAKWDRENPGVVNAKTARHRANKLCATPAWANEFFIEEAYSLAKLRSETTGIVWEVDHIVPLNSKKVCGLHVEFNLRVIPKAVNRAKSNRYWPDMPEHPNQSVGQ